MKYINNLQLVFMLIVAINIGTAQEYKFGKVSKEELLEQSYPLDSSANAVILYENKNVSINYNQSQGFQLMTEVHKRVKLYKKEGFDYATDEIFLYKQRSEDEKVVGLKGFTYSLIDGKVIETKLKGEGIFKNEYSEYYDQVKFTMPSLQEGSVIEYKYKIISPFLFNIDKINLQYEIPIKQLNVSLNFPEYFHFKKFTSGYLPINLKENSKLDKIAHTNKTRTGGGFSSPVTSNTTTSTIDFKTFINTINSTNVPAFKVEPYSGNIKNYISSINYELSHINFPNQPIKYYSTTWEDVTKTIFKSENFGGELKKKNYYEEDLKAIVSKTENEATKLSKVFEYVKNRMNWNGKYAVATSIGVKKAYKEKTGNAAEINIMLTAMLSYMGLDANPVLVSSSNRVMALFPTLDGFNYVITRVKLVDGSIAYLDATDKYGVPNVLPDRVIRGSGRIIASNGTSQQVSLRPENPSMDRYNIQCEIDGEGMISGKFNVRHMDYLAHAFRTKYGERDIESKAGKFKAKYEIEEIKEYDVKGINDYGKGVSESFNFISYNQIELIDEEMYFSPLLFLRDKENLFKSENREHPIDFGYGFTNTYMVNIKIPEDYEVVTLPKPKAFKLPNGMGSFTFRSGIANGMIQVVVNETIAKPFLPSISYPYIKQFYNQVVEKENEQIVLKKI
ncbi:DUF3857 domain-containing protein [Aquimarina sp. U1-2]|uniref:DUF3857 domain-containing protein n=1 Tax=Aquimarina sp. U1-2 TaxID=2823141 RepID=UPI001AECE55B|nr:DUF3857 domain-containing protein [Aquimarina sp. U1-2]MBP2833724.1 DUF3857 domain-containing protein [Aquimarina sp. U1-2]